MNSTAPEVRMTLLRTSLLRALLPWLGLIIFFTLQAAAQTQANSSTETGARVIFTFAGTASGTFRPVDGAATTFTNEPFTITAAINAGDVVKEKSYCTVPSQTCTILSAPVLWASISVAGVAADFTSRLAVFDNQTYPAVGLRRDPGGDLLDLQHNTFFATYDLKEAIAPEGTFFEKPHKLAQFNCGGGCVTTSLGVLTLDSVRDVRFKAVRKSGDVSPMDGAIRSTAQRD
jgi:hypothetical protein